MADNEVWIQRAVIAAVVGIYGWFLRHISTSKRHPCSSDIVYHDVCDAERKRLDDCIEAEVKRSQERYTELRQDMKEGFKELKQLVKNSKS